MALFERTSNGLRILKSSLEVLNSNKQLLLFPLLSGASLAVVLAALFTGAAGTEWVEGHSRQSGNGLYPLIFFCGYVVCYFVIVFFNMALMHCVNLQLDGRPAPIADGLRFSVSRLNAILAWAIFAATVGTLLRLVRDNAGRAGRILASVLGMVWGVTTFFVVPIIAYENVGPFDAVKRSAQIMKERWGESLVASFSFTFILPPLILVFSFAALALSSYVSETAGILVFAGGFLLVAIASSALNAIFIAIAYKSTTGNTNLHLSNKMLDGLFDQQE